MGKYQIKFVLFMQYHIKTFFTIQFFDHPVTIPTVDEMMNSLNVTDNEKARLARLGQDTIYQET